jgi:Tfp pilus assembly protein PilO
MKQPRARVSHLAWTIKRSLVRLRWPGLAGLVLLVFAVSFALLGIEPAKQRLASLTGEQAQLAAQVNVRGPQQRPQTVRGQLSNFYAFFPMSDGVPQLLAKIQQAAQRNRLTLDKGEYKLAREQDFPVVRYQVTFPVVGEYTQVRGFVNTVLDTVPAAAVDELVLKREDIGDEQLEARVRFSLFLGVRP